MVAFRASRLNIRPPLLGPALLLLCAAIVGLLAFPNTDLLIVLLCVPFVALLGVSDTLVGRAFSCGPVYWLGLVSYSIYLDHRLVETALHNPITEWLTASRVPHAFTLTIPILCGLSIACAGVTFRYIEEPCRDAVRRLFHQPTTPIQEEAGAP